MPEYTYKIKVNNSSYCFKYRAYLYVDGDIADGEFCSTLWGAKLWVKKAKRKHEKRIPRIVDEGVL